MKFSHLFLLPALALGFGGMDDNDHAPTPPSSSYPVEGTDYIVRGTGCQVCTVSSSGTFCMNPNGNGGFVQEFGNLVNHEAPIGNFDIVQFHPPGGVDTFPSALTDVALWAGRGEGGLRLWGVDPHNCDGCNNNMFSGDRNQWDLWTTGWGWELYGDGDQTWSRVKAASYFQIKSRGSDRCVASIDTSKCMEEATSEAGLPEWNDCGQTCDTAGNSFFATCENWPGV